MTQDEMKKLVAQAAVEQVRPYFDQGAIIGIGTGSTADLFIDALAVEKQHFAGAVASSERSAQRLGSHGIKVLDLNSVESLPIYVDGADEVNAGLAMIKGGGAALTREKIVAAVAEKFVCIADASKLVDVLGRFPLPVEVIPMASAQVARRLRQLGGANVEVSLRLLADGTPLITDNHNHILDVRGMKIADPLATEAAINAMVGVVTNGLFAARGADILLLGTETGVKLLVPASN